MMRGSNPREDNVSFVHMLPPESQLELKQYCIIADTALTFGGDGEELYLSGGSEYRFTIVNCSRKNR